MYRNKASISDHYSAVLKFFEETIMRKDDQYIRDTETSQMVSDLMKSEHMLKPIEFDSAQKESMRHEKQMRSIPAHMREESYRYDGNKEFEYETIWITIPIIPNPTILVTKDLTTNHYSMGWSPDDFSWDLDKVTLSIDIKGYGFEFDDQKVMNGVADLKKRVHEWVGWANADIERGNAMIQNELAPLINNRKQKLSKDGDRLSNLSEKMGIPLE